MRIMRINFQQFVKQRAIVDHRLPHFFRAGFPPLSSQRERARGTVILNDDWMIHGHIGGAPIEVFERVAARRHHLGDEQVGLADRAVRIVDEARLDAAAGGSRHVRRRQPQRFVRTPVRNVRED